MATAIALARAGSERRDHSGRGEAELKLLEHENHPPDRCIKGHGETSTGTGCIENFVVRQVRQKAGRISCRKPRPFAQLVPRGQLAMTSNEWL